MLNSLVDLCGDLANRPLGIQTTGQKVYRAIATGICCMCKSPLCPNDCRPVSRNPRTRQQHMSRTYIRVSDAQRKQHYVPVGWWCPSCHAFRDDVR